MLYYAGMIHKRNAVLVVRQCLTVVAIISLFFFFFGYSLIYGPPNPSSSNRSSLFYGDASRLWFWGINPTSINSLAPTIPEAIYALFELNFAIITATLVMGSMADRVKFSSMAIFTILWHIGVYCPIAHSNW